MTIPMVAFARHSRGSTLFRIEPELVQVRRRASERRCAGDRVDGVRRLLVVRNDRLGDVILTLPAIAALRATYPDAWLGFMVHPGVAPLVRHVPAVDEIVLDPGDLPGAQQRIAAFRPDLIVCISRGSRIPWAARKAEVPARIGTGYRVYSRLFDRRVEERRRGAGLHEAELALSFAHRAGAPEGDADFPIRVPQEAADSARNWLALHGIDGPFVVLHPGSGGSCPSWPVGHHIQMATLLEGQGRRVVFSIGPGEDHVTAALDDEHPRIRRLPRFDGGLLALAALTSIATLVVASSTGPTHVAAALGTPVLAFHAPWPTCSASRWGPYAENGWALVAASEEARRWGRSQRRRMGALLMQEISPPTALACVEDLMDGRPPRV